MNYRFVLLIILTITYSQALYTAVEILKIKTTEQCSYYGETLPESIYGFTPDYTAEAMIEEITSYTGLRRNFTIRSSNIHNAAAVTQDGQRFLLYNQEFMNSVKQKTHSNWASISIMAHEVGHHLQGHTLNGEAGRPEKELEADEYSGFIMERMGASLDDAQSAMNAFAPSEESNTHPAKSARLLAIRAGWTKAYELSNTTKQPTLSRLSQLAIPTTEGIDRYELQNGLVKDTQTGLIWTRCSIGQSWDGYTCQGVAKRVLWYHLSGKHFEYSGYTDWRIPSIAELKTLIYCTSGQPELWNDSPQPCAGSYSKPTLITRAFPNTPYETVFLSSTVNEFDNTRVWIADFYNGVSRSESKSNFFTVRLVRN